MYCHNSEVIHPPCANAVSFLIFNYMFFCFFQAILYVHSSHLKIIWLSYILAMNGCGNGPLTHLMRIPYRLVHQSSPRQKHFSRDAENYLQESRS